MSSDLSVVSREKVLSAIATEALSAAEIAVVTGLGATTIARFLQKRRKSHADVRISAWQRIEGTSCGSARWSLGAGVDVPYPSSEFLRQDEKQRAARERLAELAKQRASIPKKAARDPMVAALFGPYRRRTNNGASA